MATDVSRSGVSRTWWPPPFPVSSRDRAYFGYFPPSTHLMVTPGDVTDSGFVDASPHRSALPAVYNQYVDTANDPSYDPAHEAIAALLRPLFLTAFLLDDFLDDNDHFGSESVVVTSASSKTAFLFADLYAQRTDRPALIGLTSPSNVDFVERLGVYDRVLDLRRGDLVARRPDRHRRHRW